LTEYKQTDFIYETVGFQAGRNNRMELVTRLERMTMRMDIPDFMPGDTVKVYVKIKEGEKERIQVFQGIVIGRHNGMANSTFTVRKISYGIGVERIFLLHSPVIDKIELVSRGKVRRAKIYYLRNLKGKAARIKERRTS
jgi:large subunit ribosomal protein L19